MPGNQVCTSIGATLFAVVAGATGQIVTPPKGCNQVFLKYVSGGSLAIVPAIGSSGTLLGVPVIAAESPWHFNGPSSFFLNAGGATSVAGLVFGFSSQGQSGIP